MPQMRGHGSWMVNSRITPNISKLKMDSSSLFMENKELDRLMRNNVETLNNKKLKMQAENKFRLMRAKYLEGSPSGQCSRTLSAPNHRAESARRPVSHPTESLRVHQTVNPGRKIPLKQPSENKNPDDDSDSGNSDRDDDDNDSLASSYKPGRSGRITFRDDNRPKTALLPPRNPGDSTAETVRPKSAFSLAFGSLKIRSYRSLRLLLNTDELTQSRYIAARESLLQEKALESSRETKLLNRRIKHFYSDLDHFNRSTRGETPKLRRPKTSSQSPFVFR